MEVINKEFYNTEDLTQYNLEAEKYCNYSESETAGNLIKDYSKEDGETELLKDYPTVQDLKYFAGLIGIDVLAHNIVKKKKFWTDLIIKHQTLWGRTKLVKGLNKVPTTLPVVFKYEGRHIPAYLSYRVQANATKYSLMHIPARVKPYYQTAPDTVEHITYLVLLDPVEHLEEVTLEHQGFTLDLKVKKNYYNFRLDRKETLRFIWRTGKRLFITFQYVDLPHTNLLTEYVVNLVPDDVVKASVVNGFDLLTTDILTPYNSTIDIVGVEIVNKVNSLTRESTLTIGKYKVSVQQNREHKNAEWNAELTITPENVHLITEKDSDLVKLIQALNTIAEDPNRYYKTMDIRYQQR